MSALSTPGGGGTTAQSKPTSGKQKYQKLDINSLYCANKNENLEPSSVKSQLSRKHGMQSLGKVPSTRRPPANLPSLKTETGQDPNTNPIAAVAPSVSSPPTCINPPTQAAPLAPSINAAAAAGPGGWVSLPPPSSPHFRTEFPSLESAAQPAHRTDTAQPQTQLRPQTEGSWTSGGATVGVRQESNASPAAVPAPAAASQQTPAYRAILPSFLVKGSTGGGLGLGGLGSLRDTRSSPAPPPSGPRPPPRAAPTPRAVEVLTARPILRDDQISSLDDISRDAGWAQHDDIDYDQKLDFSDGETSTRKNNNRGSIEKERSEPKAGHAAEPGDEEQLWAERRQKQSNEVAQAVARARQRKEEEQRRRENRDPPSQPPKDFRDRDRNDNREREPEPRERDRLESRDSRDRDRTDRDKERSEGRDRDVREKDRADNRDRDRNDRERFDNRDRDNRDNRDRERDRDRDKDPRDRGRNDNRDRADSDKESRQDIRDRDRGDNRDRGDRERFDRERDRGDRERDRSERDRDRTDRDRSERDRDFRDRGPDRDRERDHARDRDQNNPAFSKTFQANIPPRFLKQQQNRQQDEQHNKGWAFSGKPAPRRQEPQPPQTYNNAPRHAPHNNGRRSYSRDFSDREDEFRRDKDGPGPQWRSEMQDYEKSGRELDRSNSKESYKDFNEYKGKNEPDRKSSLEHAIEQSNRSAADKLSEVFERKSIGVAEPFVATESALNQASEKKSSSPDNVSQRESSEKEIGKVSWAEVAQEETNIVKPSEKVSPPREIEVKKDLILPNFDSKRNSQHPIASTSPPQNIPSNNTTYANAFQNKLNNTPNIQALGGNNQQLTQTTCLPITQQQVSQPLIQASSLERQTIPKPIVQPPSNIADSFAASQMQKQQQQLSEQLAKLKYSQQSEKDASESGLTSKLSIESQVIAAKTVEIAVETVKNTPDMTKRLVDDKKPELQGIHEPSSNKIILKEPIERKSSGSGSEKKGRGFGGGGTGFAVYNNRGWGSRESRGRRSHRNSRSNNRASESDGSTDGAPNVERKDRRRAPRSPRGPKKQERHDGVNRTAPTEQGMLTTDGLENREPFAPRGQPSRRGRGGFQGTARPPAPAKRVTSYGPPNTKSPFNQTNRAAKENEEGKDNMPMEEKSKGRPRLGSQATGRGRDRRPKGPVSGEDDNWETTSEHSEGGGGRRRSVPGRPSQKGQGGRNQNSRNNPRNNNQGVKKDNIGDNKTADLQEAMIDLKISTAKKDEDVADDGFQEVRNKKNSKDARGPPAKEENQQAAKQQPRSHSNQGNGRNGSSSRNSSDKSNPRGAVPVSNKNGQYDPRPRQANLAPRFVKQRQKQQLGMVSGYGPDTGAAPPPPAVNAWDKPIAQTLRGNIEEPIEVTVNKSAQSSQRSTPLEAPIEIKPLAAAACAVPTDKSEVLDGTTPPVETIIFENTNYKSAPSEEALQQKYQISSNIGKSLQPEEMSPEMEAHPLAFNGADVRRPRSIQELIGDNGRPVSDGESSLGLQMSFDTTQKAEDSSDMKLDFAFDSDLGQLTEDKSAKSLGMPRGVHMSTSNTISPLAADLNLKIASVKKVWEMPAVAEGTEDLQFAGFEEQSTETGAPPNVCKVKPTQQLQSPPPQHYNHVGYQGGYGGLSVPSPPAMLFNSTQQLLGSSQQLPQQAGLYGAFLDQSRGQFGGFPGAPYGAGSGAPYNYQPPPDMFQSLPNQYRMAATAGGGGFGQSGQLGNNPSTVLISSTSNSLMSATVKPSSQQIGAIGSKGGGVGGVGGVSAYQQQYLGYSAPVGEAPYSLPGLLPRPAPPQSSYYSPYQPASAPAPTYPLQFTQQPQSGAFGSQFLSSQLQVAAAVQQMQQQQQQQQQYRGPMQQQYAPAPPRQVPQQQLKSPLHEHANGFAPLCDSVSPTPKQQQQNKQQKPPHSPPQHKYHAPPPHPPPALTPHQHHQQQQQQQMVSGGSNGRCGGGGGGGGVARGGMSVPPRYPAPIQRPHAPAMPLYRHAQPPPPRAHLAPPHPRHALYYQHHQRNGGGGGGERAAEVCSPATATGDESVVEPAAAAVAVVAAAAASVSACAQDAPPAATPDLKVE